MASLVQNHQNKPMMSYSRYEVTEIKFKFCSASNNVSNEISMPEYICVRGASDALSVRFGNESEVR